MENEFEYKITIGIPVYNVEKYIKKCFDSILAQDIDGIEILVVDDCGTDNSIQIVKELCTSNNDKFSIRIISHTHNKGVAEARNTILKNAKGKYLFFLDPDDYIEVGSLTLLYEEAEKCQAEVTYGSIAILKDGEIKPFKIYPLSHFSGDGVFASYVYNSLNEKIFTSSINTLYLMNFIRYNHISFPNVKIGEDYLFREAFLPRVNKAAMRPEITYYYVMRPNSLMQYQYRETIDIKEALYKLWFCQQLKETCIGLENTDYYAGKCVQIMKSVLYDICGIQKHLHQLTGDIPQEELNKALKHPAKLSQILRFHRFRKTNLFFYLMGILPTNLTIFIITFIGKRKGWL